MRIFSRVMTKLLIPFFAFIFAFFIGGLIIVLSDAEIMSKLNSPIEFLKAALSKIGNSYLAIFQGSIYDINLARGESIFKGFYPLSETMVAAIPLILTGLSVTLAFRSGLFNIGAQGQFIFGALGASYVGFNFSLPSIIHPISAILAGILLAGFYGGIVGLLKAKTGAHEVIVTIMLNYIAGFFILWILKTSTFLRPGRLDPIAPEVSVSARLPQILGVDLRIHFGIFIALAAAYFVYWLLKKSSLGFKFRAVGANSQAAKSAGISIAFVTTSTMVLSGALAGLGGAVHVLGTEYALVSNIGGSLGFDAITVALLGGASPFGTVIAAIFFAALRTGGMTLQSNTGTPAEIIQVIQALIVLFIAAPTLIKGILRLKQVVGEKTLVAKGWNS